MTTHPERADLWILRAINEFHALIPRQVIRLLYAPSSQEHVSRRLCRLERQGWVWRRKYPNMSGDGSVPFRYFLTPLGARYVEETGVPIRYISNEKRERASSGILYPHEILSIDALIAATLLVRQLPDREIVQRQHDRELKQAHGAAILDGYVHGRNRRTGSAWRVGIEVDRGTESSVRWLGKVRRLVTLDLDAIAVVTLDAARRDFLARATDDPCFAFTCASPLIDPVAFFGGPHWVIPGEPGMQPLLELEGTA